MPIFEYLCMNCGSSFEKLVVRDTGETYRCPSCESEETKKKLSVFSGIVKGNTVAPCPSMSACESQGSPCCGGGKCPMG